MNEEDEDYYKVRKPKQVEEAIRPLARALGVKDADCQYRYDEKTGFETLTVEGQRIGVSGDSVEGILTELIGWAVIYKSRLYQRISQAALREIRRYWH